MLGLVKEKEEEEEVRVFDVGVPSAPSVLFEEGRCGGGVDVS